MYTILATCGTSLRKLPSGALFNSNPSGRACSLRQQPPPSRVLQGSCCLIASKFRLKFLMIRNHTPRSSLLSGALFRNKSARVSSTRSAYDVQPPSNVLLNSEPARRVASRQFLGLAPFPSFETDKPELRISNSTNPSASKPNERPLNPRPQKKP